MNDTVRFRKLALTALFVAVGILLAPFSIPLGAAKTFPFQHMLNVLIAVFLGWRYGVAGAFCVSSIRIALGMGTILAYPGSMIGAALSGILYARTGKLWGAVVGEIIGTGLLGGLLSYPLAAYILGSRAATLFFFVFAFLPNTVVGAVLGALIYKVMPAKKLKEFV